MDQAEARNDIAQLLERERPNRYVSLLAADGPWVTSDGVLASASKSSATFGFGVRSNLTLSPELLTELDVQCRLNVIGHLWLSPGSGDDQWSIMWGVKVFYPWCDGMTVARTLFDCLANRDGLMGMMTARLESFGGVDFWSSITSATPGGTDLGVAGLVMVGHLA